MSSSTRPGETADPGVGSSHDAEQADQVEVRLLRWDAALRRTAAQVERTEAARRRVEATHERTKAAWERAEAARMRAELARYRIEGFVDDFGSAPPQESPEAERVAEQRELVSHQREWMADEREVGADEREQAANRREAEADERERLANQREAEADARERLANQREAEADERRRLVDRREANLPWAGAGARARLDEKVGGRSFELEGSAWPRSTAPGTPRANAAKLFGDLVKLRARAADIADTMADEAESIANTFESVPVDEARERRVRIATTEREIAATLRTNAGRLRQTLAPVTLLPLPRFSERTAEGGPAAPETEP